MLAQIAPANPLTWIPNIPSLCPIEGLCGLAQCRRLLPAGILAAVVFRLGSGLVGEAPYFRMLKNDIFEIFEMIGDDLVLPVLDAGTAKG